MAAGLLATNDLVRDMGDFLFAPLQSRPHVELIVVMLLCPWLLTMVQFWLFDSILMADSGDGESHRRVAYGGGGKDGGKRAPLLACGAPGPDGGLEYTGGAGSGALEVRLLA